MSILVLAFGIFSGPAQIIYPVTRTTNQIDFYQGVAVKWAFLVRALEMDKGHAAFFP